MMERNRPRIRPRILERLVAVREVQSAAGEELCPFFGRTLLPSVLDRACQGKCKNVIGEELEIFELGLGV